MASVRELEQEISAMERRFSAISEVRDVQEGKILVERDRYKQAAEWIAIKLMERTHFSDELWVEITAWAKTMSCENHKQAIVAYALAVTRED